MKAKDLAKILLQHPEAEVGTVVSYYGSMEFDALEIIENAEFNPAGTKYPVEECGDKQLYNEQAQMLLTDIFII